MTVSRREEKKSHFISDTAEMYTKKQENVFGIECNKKVSGCKCRSSRVSMISFFSPHFKKKNFLAQRQC